MQYLVGYSLFGAHNNRLCFVKKHHIAIIERRTEHAEHTKKNSRIHQQPSEASLATLACLSCSKISWIGIPRKQGASTTITVETLLMLDVDVEEGGEVTADAESGEIEDEATPMLMLEMLDTTATIIAEALCITMMVHRINIHLILIRMLLHQGETRR